MMMIILYEVFSLAFLYAVIVLLREGNAGTDFHDFVELYAFCSATIRLHPTKLYAGLVKQQ